jgi:hypothetical protein
MRKRKKKITTAGPIFVSPDGGETVYQQLPDGNRVLVEQSQKARDEETGLRGSRNGGSGGHRAQEEVPHTEESMGSIPCHMAFSQR